ncbi:protein LURP-one-related 6-like [Nicotiana tabacum]|uniref:Protein LURP-one-related 6-like n=1 Tax=Nicotiana tabacum TaxID=4097 RepID=A0A1S4CZ00_TOBAC|nr:PREDICTED: protein LURP-one-related 6-like [Nicotiana tabacum]
MATTINSNMAVVSKVFCSSSEVVLVVRRRPHVVNGGGFIVTNCAQNVVFKVDGCGILGKKEELILKDSYGHDLLLIRKKGGVIEALSMQRKWRGYSKDFEGSEKLVFCLKEPKNSCFLKKMPIKISIEQKDYNDHKIFQIAGYFPDRSCSIIDSSGNVIAKVGARKEVQQVMPSNDVYTVTVKAGIDQAFVVGVIAILDYIYDGSTKC